jgi:uncharacterized ferritin-like protein (DUF455 family)
MELAEFARQILFEPTLEAKLFTPERLNDLRPGRRIDVPPSPARHRSIGFPNPGDRVRAALPSIRDLEQERERGVLLHFFANHELLALELMALALLRFPDAPSKFRRGLAGTMLEEQRHLRLYTDRMRAWGIDFGHIPVNRYFWDVIADTPSPLTFVTQMSLTLEQANLDFSKHYLKVFQALGDDETTSILQTVYDDEIGHVRHGVHWFQEWKPEDLTDWDAYKAVLPLPMTPARAKGACYDIQGRQKAGLSDQFIQELRIYQHSKGRPPRVFWFNPEFEEDLASGQKDFVPPKALRDIRDDLSHTLLLLAGRDDVVISPLAPSTAFMTQLQNAGFPGCQVVTQSRDLNSRLLQSFEPWGRSSSASLLAASIKAKWMEPVEAPLSGNSQSPVGSKIWAKEIALELAPDLTPGEIIRSEAELLANLAKNYRETTAILKAPFGTAGRNAMRILPGAALTPEQKAWTSQTLSRQKALVVEPWLEKVADFSVQIVVGREDHTVLGLTRFLTNNRGQYVGHILGRKLDGLTPDVVRAYHEQDVAGRLMDLAAKAASKLHFGGYVGPAGIDALMYRNDYGIHLYPIVEINTRYTMGRLAIALDRRVHASVNARWLHISKGEIERRGEGSLQDFAVRISGLVPITRKSECLTSGIIFTNDPTTAKAVLSVLFVGDEALQIAERLKG